MNRVMSAFACIALCVVTYPVAGKVDKQPIVIVQGPTIVAFFKPVPPARLKADPDANEALSDFQLYAKNVRGPLEKAGIEFHELYADSFRLRVENELITFRPDKMGVGYYLVAPARKPRIEYGVMTDSDLLQLAKEYFGITR
jgi:hypothetical protein